MTGFARSCLASTALLVAAAIPADALVPLRAENIATGFVRAVFVTAPRGDATRLFVVEKRGTIQIVENGVTLPSPFLDIQSIVASGGNEQGLLGLEFDPDYDTNGWFYVYYTRPGGAGISQISRYSVSANPNVADSGSEYRIYQAQQNASNHNGGHIEFSPIDGYLYWGSGDGGGANDTGNRAQTGTSQMGKMMRFDVYGDDFPLDSTRNYAVPPTNPFIGTPSFLDEIWGYGLRNPYRWAFDEATGDMYIGDVGQNCWEEISVQPAASTGGENYGWRIKEGTRCFDGNDAFNCNQPTNCGSGLTDPVHEYNHSTDGFSCSLTGGRVYNGDAIPALKGTYFYADYCSDQTYTFRWDGTNVLELQKRTSELSPAIGGGTVSDITAFGRDGLGELYIVKGPTFGSTGTIFKIVADSAAVDTPHVEHPSRFALSNGAPNPFRGTTRFSITMDRDGPVTVGVYDAAGRLVRDLHSGETIAGSIPVEWDGRDDGGRKVPAGTYFVRAKAGDHTVSKAVTRLR